MNEETGNKEIDYDKLAYDITIFMIYGSNEVLRHKDKNKKLGDKHE